MRRLNSIPFWSLPNDVVSMLNVLVLWLHCLYVNLQASSLLLIPYKLCVLCRLHKTIHQTSFVSVNKTIEMCKSTLLCSYKWFNTHETPWNGMQFMIISSFPNVEHTLFKAKAKVKANVNVNAFKDPATFVYTSIHASC